MVTTPMRITTSEPIKKVPDWLVEPVPLKIAVFKSMNPIKITRTGKMYFCIRRFRSSIMRILVANLIFFSKASSHIVNKMATLYS